MNILAGGIFLGKKPRIENNNNIEQENISWQSINRDVTERHNACELVIPPAKPSSPSHRFVALVMNILQKSEKMPNNLSSILSKLLFDSKIYSAAAKN